MRDGGETVMEGTVGLSVELKDRAGAALPRGHQKAGMGTFLLHALHILTRGQGPCSTQCVLL